MELQELSAALKKTATMIDGFLEKSEIKNGFECAKEYVKENKLDYIEEEIMMAFRHGFHTGVKQERSGKFKE